MESFATPLFLVLILIKTSDLIFAVDSIPAILAITHDQFIRVIMKSMEESQNEIEQELQKIRLKGKNAEELHMHIISRLDELRNEIQNLRKAKTK